MEIAFGLVLTLQRASKIRLLFLQDIYHGVSNALILKANVTIVAVNSKGKTVFPQKNSIDYHLLSPEFGPCFLQRWSITSL